MSRQTRSSDSDHESLHLGPGTGIAPGKQTLTQSLRGRERAVASFDNTSEYREDRATIDGPPSTSLLTDRQLRKARRRNPHWQDRLGFSPSIFGGGDIASGELAENIASRQSALGLPIDGIAGPNTIAAITSASADNPDATAAANPSATASTGPDATAAGPVADDDRDHDLDALFDRTIAGDHSDGSRSPGRGVGPAVRGGPAAARAIPAARGGATPGGPVDDPFGMHLLAR